MTRGVSVLRPGEDPDARIAAAPLESWSPHVTLAIHQLMPASLAGLGMLLRMRGRRLHSVTDSVGRTGHG